MESIDLGAAKMPKLGYGTWQIKGDACVEGVSDALALGYRHIDTAQIYGNEAEVGAGLAKAGLARDAVFVTTKVWPTRYGDAAASIDESLDKLGLKHVDLLLLHWPGHPSADAPWQRGLEALVEAQALGKTRLIGVSNFTPALWDEAVALAPVACNQVEYHPYLSQRRLIAKAREAAHPACLTAYSPIAQGAVLESEVLRDIGQAHGKSAVQVALRWLTQQDRVSAIPRSSSHTNRANNLAALDFALSDEEMSQIDAIGEDRRLISPAWAPDWAPRPEA